MSDNDKKIGMGTLILSEGMDEFELRQKDNEKRINDALKTPDGRLSLIKAFVDKKDHTPLDKAIAEVLAPILGLDLENIDNVQARKGDVSQKMKLSNWDGQRNKRNTDSALLNKAAAMLAWSIAIDENLGDTASVKKVVSIFNREGEEESNICLNEKTVLTTMQRLSWYKKVTSRKITTK